MSRLDAARRAFGRLFDGFWPSVRPRTRRGALLAAAGIVVASAALAVVFVAGAIVAWSPYVESVARPDTNPRSWAALELSYGDAAMCQRCHEPEFARATSGSHAGIGCESCHGASFEHALASPAGDAAVARAVPTDELCVRCHTAAVGRPAEVRQIVPDDHYVEACLQCHDPHTGISRRPLVVLHPLDNLPPCVTCHGPEGFKARNQRHPEVEGDEPCLACHAPGRGPEDEWWPAHVVTCTPHRAAGLRPWSSPSVRLSPLSPLSPSSPTRPPWSHHQRGWTTPPRRPRASCR